MERAAKRILQLLTLSALVFATWNIADEAVGHHRTDLAGAVTWIAIWMAVPGINALLGSRSTGPAVIGVTLFLAILYAAFFLKYALDGSSADEGPLGGAGHMHILFVPFLLLLISPLVWYLAYRWPSGRNRETRQVTQ